MINTSTKNNKHFFSIFVSDLSNLIQGCINNQIIICDKRLYKRLISVLRLKPNDYFILFDYQYNIIFSLDKKTFENKKCICANLIQQKRNKPFNTEIIFCPALLKKSSFENIIYFSAQMGATKIIPVLTEKVQRKFEGEKERQRLEKIIISACEQSKNFNVPELCGALNLKKIFKKIEEEESKNSKKVLFDYSGSPLIMLLNEIHNEKTIKVFILIGPEGDFTTSEISLIRENNFKLYKLTPTILRSTQAAAVGLGSIRSVAD
ncbi:RsmE family RNA methyltransferase [Candidatus Dependentiae bacterium]|nr:RsmE family RNA methyltransferase [Candidatus Dependentiae bacterium]